MYSLDSLAVFIHDSRQNLTKFVKAQGIKLTKDDYRVVDFFVGYLQVQIKEAKHLEELERAAKKINIQL